MLDCTLDPANAHVCYICGADRVEGLSLHAPAEGEVDGLSTDEVDALFAEADHDGDGRLVGNEAKAFFQRTSLPVQALSKVQHIPCSSTLSSVVISLAGCPDQPAMSIC